MTTTEANKLNACPAWHAWREGKAVQILECKSQDHWVDATGRTINYDDFIRGIVRVKPKSNIIWLHWEPGDATAYVSSSEIKGYRKFVEAPNE